MTKQIERGKPLNELTKGSLDYTLYLIKKAFYAQFDRWADDQAYFWVEEVFADYLIVHADNLHQDEFYYVEYTIDAAGSYTFTPRDEWEVVSLSYTRAAPVMESARPQGEGGGLSETFQLELTEAAKTNTDGPWRIKAIGSTAGEVNRNGRRRAAFVIEESVRQLKQRFAAGQNQGRLILTGEADHPQHKGRDAALFSEVIIVWDQIDFDGKHTLIEGSLLPTAAGRDAYIRMKAGVKPDVSQRSYGRSVLVSEDGEQIEEVLQESIHGYDLVNGGADPNAFAQFAESRQPSEQRPKRPSNPTYETHKEDKPMDLEKLRQEYPELVAKIEAEQDDRQRKLLEKQLEAQAAQDKRIADAVAAREAQLREQLAKEAEAKLEAERAEREKAEQALAQLREAEAKRQVADHVSAQVEALAYPAGVKKAMRDSILTLELKSVEAANAVLETKRAEYDAIMSNFKLAQQGMVQVVGPVLETETGTPEFARGAFQLLERMIERRLATRRDLRKLETPNAVFTRRYLEAFDKAYKTQLVGEAEALRQWQEAETTSDLNLPYSVSRAVIEEAVPELVALSIFDFGLEDNSPTRLYYEAYATESGAAPTVTDESFTSVHNTWVDLDNKRIRGGTVVVTSSPAGTTYDEYDDYVVDYGNGKIMVLSTGDMANSTAFLVDYVYDKVRAGENQAIQRGKGQLSYQTINLVADRLATLVTDEAITFSRTQMGWDAVTRTISMVIRELREMIDSHIIRLAIASAVKSGNAGGTWTSASDAVSIFVQKLGLAAAAVEADNYMAQWFLMSTTNAERLSNWDGFKRDGFPDAVLNAAGYVGQVKGRPVFKSNQCPDAIALTGHTELVQHRVLSSKPMMIKGPFQAYSSGNLVAAQEYYAEEYNATESFLPNKGGYVRVA